MTPNFDREGNTIRGTQVKCVCVHAGNGESQNTANWPESSVRFRAFIVFKVRRI